VDTTHEEGWVKLYRKSIESQVFQNEGLWKIWCWCLLRANHKDSWVPVKTGKGRSTVFVKRGQFIFGRKTAAKELKMKPSTVQKRMQILANMQNLIIQSNTHYSLITIRNYDYYQGNELNEVSSKVSTKYHPSITNKNDKNEKNKNIGRSKPLNDPKVKEFFSLWSETFRQEIGQPYLFSYGKEGKLAKSLLQVHSIETLQDLVRLFFKDEQCKRRGLTIGIFYQEINRLIGLKELDPLAQARREVWGENQAKKQDISGGHW